MRIAVFGDNGIGRWYAQLFDHVENITFYISEKNKQGLHVTEKPKYILSNKKEILNALKQPIKAFYRFKENNFDRKLDFHYFEIEDIVKKGCFDIAITKSDRSLYTLASLKNKYNNFQLVYWVPFTIPFVDMFDQRSFFIRNYAFDKIDFFIAITKTCKNTLVYEGIDTHKIIHIYPGIDTHFFKKRMKTDVIKVLNKDEFSDTFNLLYVGKLVTWKGVFTLLYALKILKQDIGNIKLIIIGNGAQKENLKLLASLLDVNDCIHWINHVAYSEIAFYYNIADIFILPSLPSSNFAEQFGYVVAEAMSSGIPTIVSKVGGLPEVVDHREELLFTPGNYHELAEKILVLNKDVLLYETISTECEVRARTYFDAFENGKKIEALFEQKSIR